MVGGCETVSDLLGDPDLCGDFALYVPPLTAAVQDLDRLNRKDPPRLLIGGGESDSSLRS